VIRAYEGRIRGFLVRTKGIVLGGMQVFGEANEFAPIDLSG
jgi:hypothetical protein